MDFIGDFFNSVKRLPEDPRADGYDLALTTACFGFLHATEALSRPSYSLSFSRPSQSYPQNQRIGLTVFSYVQEDRIQEMEIKNYSYDGQAKTLTLENQSAKQFHWNGQVMEKITHDHYSTRTFTWDRGRISRMRELSHGSGDDQVVETEFLFNEQGLYAGTRNTYDFMGQNEIRSYLDYLDREIVQVRIETKSSGILVQEEKYQIEYDQQGRVWQERHQYFTVRYYHSPAPEESELLEAVIQQNPFGNVPEP